MTKENGLWNDTPNIFVAFLDIMGFRDRVFREKHDVVEKMLESLRPAIEDIEKDAKKRLQDQLHLQEKTNVTTTSSIYPVSFSDSIILFSNDDSEDSATEVIINAAYIFSEAIDKEIPMKGAIAFGEMTVNIDKSLYFGKPLIDAYDLQNELLFYGVVLHHTFERRLGEKGMGDILENELAQQYPVPMKLGKISHNSINWTFMSEKPQDSVNKLYNSVSGAPRIFVDNTLEFVRWIQAKELELKKKDEKEKPV